MKVVCMQERDSLLLWQRHLANPQDSELQKMDKIIENVLFWLVIIRSLQQQFGSMQAIHMLHSYT